MTVTPDGQQRRVDPGPGRDIHLPVPELVSFRTGEKGSGFGSLFATGIAVVT